MSRQSNYVNPLFQYGENELNDDIQQEQEDDELINQIFSSFQDQPEYEENDMIYSENFDQYINQTLPLDEDFFLNNSYEQEFYEDIVWAENDLGFTTGFLPELRLREISQENYVLPGQIENIEYFDEENNEYYTDEEL